MMRRLYVLAFTAGLVFLSRPAYALLDALTTIEQFESGGQNVKNFAWDATHTASGLYQITNSTFNSTIAPGLGLGKVGPGTDYPNGVMDLSPDVQQKAAAYLYQQQGLGPWVCSGCNDALAKFVQANGGAGAFGLNGVEVAAAGNLPAATNGTVMTTAEAAAIEASKQPGVLSHPFTWMNEKTLGAVQTGMTAQIDHMQQFTAKFLPWWLQFAVIGIGLAALFGGGGHGKAEKFVASVMIVMISVSVGSQMYQKIAIDPVMGLPGVWQQYIVNAFGVISSDKPDAMMDAVFAGASAMEQRIMKSAPTGISNLGDRVGLAITLGVGHYLIVFSLGCMWVSKAALTFASMIGLELGPLLIPFILFESTKFVFWNWVWLLVSALFGKLIVDLILGMYAGVMAQLLLSTSITGNPATDGPGFVAMVIIMLVLGISTLAMGAVGTIVFGHRMHANMAASGYYMSAGPLRRMMAQTARGAI